MSRAISLTGIAPSKIAATTPETTDELLQRLRREIKQEMLADKHERPVLTLGVFERRPMCTRCMGRGEFAQANRYGVMIVVHCPDCDGRGVVAHSSDGAAPMSATWPQAPQPPFETRVCPRCRGLGSSTPRSPLCLLCAGRGYIDTPTPSDRLVVCHTCDGQGAITNPVGSGLTPPPARITCPTCTGRGGIEVARAIAPVISLIEIVDACRPRTLRTALCRLLQRAVAEFGLSPTSDLAQEIGTLRFDLMCARLDEAGHPPYLGVTVPSEVELARLLQLVRRGGSRATGAARAIIEAHLPGGGNGATR